MIGYYVHHHGAGHMMRAQAIAARLDESVTFYSSLPQPASLRAGDCWLRLAPDTGGVDDPRDTTARGRLHWAPLGEPGLALRGRQLLDAIVSTAPRRVVVDVSVEVALLIRLAGIPVTIVAMPGRRTDPPHELVYDIADQIIAPWSAAVYAPEWLQPHRDRTHYVGFITRFDGRTRCTPRSSGRGVLLAGTGGAELPDTAIDELKSAVPQLHWKAIGGNYRWVDDVWRVLDGADVVVTHAGQSAVADVALARPAAVLLPQHRPFDEQHATADALARAGIVVSNEGWPARGCWPTLIAQARSLNPHRWDVLGAPGAAGRAARVIAG